MKQKLLVSSILLGLVAALPVGSLHAQAAGDQTDKKEERLQTVQVTGSLIPQAQIETASPVITISTQQLERSGFGTVYDALRAQPISTGAVQDNQFSGGFTPGATTISLLGLDPGFTLYLINGHPMADYPLLYNGTSNFVDLTDIPVGMVDHIDILPGNQSSIYGSSAIAGVINIILKDKIDGYELNIRAGAYSQGGGSNQRFEFIGGHSFGGLDVMFGLQLSNQKPIWSFDRDLTRSRTQNPDPELHDAARTFLYATLGAHPSYNDPGAEACAPLSNLVGGTVKYSTRSGGRHYCGTTEDIGYSTLLNDNRAGTAYLNTKYKLNDSAEAYANVLFNASRVYLSSGPYFWQGDIDHSGYIINADTGNFDLFQRLFTPEEVGSTKGYSDHFIDRSFSAWGGVRGTVGTNWDYDAYYARSQNNLTEHNPWPLKAAVQNFFEQQFLGPLLGTTSGYKIYSPNVANFYKAITPAQYATFASTIETKSLTWTQNANLTVNNTDLFELPSGAVGFAGLFQVGNQSWQNPTDPRVIGGEFYGLTGTSGGGMRNNWATAAEFRVPIMSMLTADASVRYDQYDNQSVGGGDNKGTYKLGLEFRPTDAFLFRGNYATAFRAPDMAFSFGGQSGFFQPNVTDYYRCAVVEPDKALADCTYYASQDPFALHHGNSDLKSITAKSFGFGAVWSPSANFNVKADYYNVKIKNEVLLQSIDQLLKTEAACRTGGLDINSPQCVQALSQVDRAGNTGGQPYHLNQVTVLPINIANEHVSGILATLDYRYDLGRWGALSASAKYNVTLKHSYRRFPDEPTIDLLREPFYSSEFKTIGNASLTWDIDKFSTSVYGTRYGKTPNYWAQLNSDGYATPCGHASANYVVCPGTVPPWMLYNASLTYNITDDMRISGIVNNIKDSGPPRDATYTALPFYNFTNYNPYGREYWLEFDWRFGRGSKD